MMLEYRNPEGYTDPVPYYELADRGKRFMSIVYICIAYTGGSTFKYSDTAAAKAVAERTYKVAVELFAMLCNKFLLDPPADGVVISHKEGHARGITFNHGAPEHLWS